MLYKVTAEDGFSCHGGHGYWPLPNGAPGEWVEVTGHIIPCENGLHLCREMDLCQWLGPVIWEAEHEGEIIEAGDKMLARRARLLRRCEGWREQTSRLFAADCAERVLHMNEDPCCAAAVRSCRRYAFGLVTEEHFFAAGDSGCTASWAASCAAACALACAAAGDAAGASWAATGDDAWYAAGDDAWYAERKWQTERLIEYLYSRVDIGAIREAVK